MSTADLSELEKLHACLQDPGQDKDEAGRLLRRYNDFLLRTLEREPSSDAPKGDNKKAPAFPKPGAASSDEVVQAASTILQVDARAAGQLLDLFKRKAYNDAHALTKGRGEEEEEGVSSSSLLAAEL